jgi:hypothetical protein
MLRKSTIYLYKTSIMAQHISSEKKPEAKRSFWDLQVDEKMTRVLGIGTPDRAFLFCEWSKKQIDSGKTNSK